MATLITGLVIDARRNIVLGRIQRARLAIGIAVRRQVRDAPAARHQRHRAGDHLALDKCLEQRVGALQSSVRKAQFGRCRRRASSFRDRAHTRERSSPDGRAVLYSK